MPRWLRRVPVTSELFDIVDETEELPLCIDFRASAKRKAIEPFVVNVGHYGLIIFPQLGVATPQLGKHGPVIGDAARIEHFGVFQVEAG